MNCKKSTVRSYASHIVRFLRYVGDKGLDYKTVPDSICNSYTNHLRNDWNYQEHQVSPAVSILRRFYRWMVGQGIVCKKNPFVVVNHPLLLTSEVQKFSKADIPEREIKLLVSGLSFQRDVILFILNNVYKLSIEALLDVKVTDFDFFYPENFTYGKVVVTSLRFNCICPYATQYNGTVKKNEMKTT